MRARKLSHWMETRIASAFRDKADNVVTGNGVTATCIDALKENGVPYDYVEFPKSNHGMYNDIDKLQEFINLSLEYCDKYFGK